MKVLSVFGTRPEAIKMCPLVLELKKYPNITSEVCTTGQHREMLNQVMEVFAVKADYSLDIMARCQTLSHITTEVLKGMEKVLQKAQPDIVLVHGDTTTSFAAALAAFYQKIPVGHVEAGLRTYDKYSPFPEEINRNLVSKIADFHFAPTQENAQALARENITQNVYVTGNTVIDSFAATVKENYTFKNPALNAIDFGKKVAVLTAHRRENWGNGLDNICSGVLQLANKYQDIFFVYPVHLNPTVQKQVREKLSNHPQILLTEPVDVQDMHNLIAKCRFVLTDSGGLQEEAPHLKKPVVVLRKETERPEAVKAGTAVVAGAEKENIVKIVSRLMEEEDWYKTMANSQNPYGDGRASERIAKILRENFKKKEKS